MLPKVKHVLLIGVSGFIGYRLAERLVVAETI